MTVGKACIIGAGSSGIVAAKIFKERGISFDCFEMGSGIGGNWRYQNDNGVSSAYKSLHINTSRGLMAYSDFPMPEDYPDYPHHSLILKYFDRYVEHFGIGDDISFNTRVLRVSPDGAGGWEVSLDTGETLNYAWVVVANGHHWDPHFPDPPLQGSLDGEILHSHHYKTPEKLAGKNVVVLGIGNSAVDIACELARFGGKTVIATRSGAYIIPKFVFGKPTDTLTKPPLSDMPLWFQRLSLGLTLWLSRGKQENYGIPKPDRKLLKEHPTVSQDLLSLVGHGDIVIKPNIRRLDGREIEFEDGSRMEADALILATGYKLSFPFFDEALLPVDNNRVRLYRHVVDPGKPGLFFVGLLQPLGAIMPLAEVQSRWVAELIQGTVGLPDKEAMERIIDKKERKDQKRYFNSPRHTLQVDFFPYYREIKKEMKRMAGKGNRVGVKEMATPQPLPHHL